LLDQLIWGDTVKIEFDDGKDFANRRKHGISLALAFQLSWAKRLSWVDRRFDYGEVRLAAVVPLNEKFYFVAYVERGNVRRIISLRKATHKEELLYVRNYQDV
jgi:uncharacterized DUF497 family protein